MWSQPKAAPCNAVQEGRQKSLQKPFWQGLFETAGTRLLRDWRLEAPAKSTFANEPKGLTGLMAGVNRSPPLDEKPTLA